MPSDEAELHERLRAADCLRNAHGHIAVAYARLDDPHIYGPPHGSPHNKRAIRETLDAVDWIRRALESMDRLEATSNAS